MATSNFGQITNPANLDPNIEEDRLMIEIGQVIIASKEKAKNEAFPFALSQIPDAMLSGMVESVGNRSNDDHPAASSFVILATFLRQHLHGDKRGGFEATKEELSDIINTVAPYLTVELVRRRDCFGFLELPESPWAFNAAVRIREPHREAIKRTIAELEALQVPVFPLLTDEEDLRSMETQNLGVIVEMGVRGRSVATKEMLHIQPQKALPLDPEAFIKAFEDVNQRAFGTEAMPQPNLPRSVSSEVDLMDDKTRKSRRINIAQMSASPEGRMIHILHEHFGHDYEENRSAILRFYALTKLLRGTTLTEWTQKTNGGASLHPTVMVAAATVKLTKGGDFPPVKFLQEVQRLATMGKWT